MSPSNLYAALQHTADAEVARGLEAARHRADAAAVRRERSRARFARALTRKPSLRIESHIPMSHTLAGAPPAS
jgi:hypothetical protein